MPVRTTEAGGVGGAVRIPYAAIALLFAASRGALLAVGLLASALLPSGLTAQHENLVLGHAAPRPLEIWARWDAEWYLLIADQGYDVGPRLARLGLPYERTAAAGFFPLYPLLIRLLAPLLGGVGAGVLISNVALFTALLLLYRLTAAEATPGREREAGLAACAALLLYPMSLFLSAVYAESLFLVLALALFELARRERFLAAGLVGAFASATRPFGVLLVLPLLAEWWAARGRPEAGPHAARWRWAAAGLVPLGLGAFMLHCARVFGDPLAFLARQSAWRGPASGPWQAFVRWWRVGPVAHGAHGSTLELALALFTLALLVVVVRRLRPGYALFAAPALLIPLTATLWSYGRLALEAFPLFVVLGLEVAAGRRALGVAYAFVGGSVGALLMALYAAWWWAG